ncbi:putative polysaccharide biosynthesis protein [Anaerobacillus isosaccharinicus]|uniref:Polysaccharide biosynthesis protein n=1 Tax=Anaerobacillus isosaccharinicus TaxID=1532552 RepID=A0A7S7LAJ3_9BACI|nr:polysaccharide biosynthesis protein [Anaerobacillus isosaccharinicus]MBA5584122.1 polysaccharide biosynthesis protein [Anaerobacillus isosaccharinicus]QOY37469.1 polysaccharide biosynthesis protein [Anaerobacillus isosaccharinicus]
MGSEILKGKKLWQGAIYLSLAAIIIKILSAVYRIPYQNIAGDVGFYVYQQIYPIYGIAIMLSTYGFPVIISKLISEKDDDRHLIMKNAFVSLSMISLVTFSFFYFNAPWIANVMGDEQLQLPLRTVSFIFIIIPLLSVLRGFFQGQEEMLPTAVSQVTEQFSRVCAILIFTYFFIINGYGPYAAGTGAALGSIIGGFIGFITLFIFYQKHQKNTAKGRQRNPLSYSMIKTILFQGIMICFSSLILVIFQFIDSLTVLRILVENGVAIDNAKIAKGVFDRGQPLIQMGTVITTSFSLVVVPLIAKVSLEGRQDLIQKYSSLAFRISFLIGGAASIGLAVIIEPTNIMLFKDSVDSQVLAIMGLAIFFTSIFLTTSAILHGLNKVHVTVSHVFIGLLVKGILNIILIPSHGTLGAATATVFACAVCASLNILTLRNIGALPKPSINRAIKTTISLVAMGMTVFLWISGSNFLFHEAMSSRLGNTFIALTSVAMGTIIFLLFIIALRLFSGEELEQIPKIRKLAVLMQFRKR